MNSFLLLSITWFYNACHQPENDLIIAKEEHSNFVIVIPAQASKVESKAAVTLQTYVQKISKAKLPVIPENKYDNQPAIFIGNTWHTYGPPKIKWDGFFIGNKNSDLYIRGGNGQGTLYGVYYLLKTYIGCRKYANTLVVLPFTKTIKIPVNLSDLQEPAFIYRESYYPSSTDPEYLAWYGLHRFQDLWGVWGHSFFKILPPQLYFEKHPEYYAWVNDKRQPLQLCLSNEDVYKFTIQWLEKAISENPDATYWSIAQQDGGGACTCNQCHKSDAEEGGPQGSLIRFVNRVAANFPEQRFTTLAYGYTAKPPLKTKPANNVYILLSTIDAFRQQPVSATLSAAAFRKNLESWEALTNNLFIWDYTTQFTNYLAPFPDYENLQANIQYFAAHHVKGVFSQGSGETYGDMADYNSYVQASLLWNPDLDINQLNNTFLQGFYGAAAPFVSRYLQLLSNAVKASSSMLDIYGNPVNHCLGYLSPQLIDQYSMLMDKAEAAVENDSILLKRIYHIWLSLEYVVLQQSRFYGKEKYGYLLSDGSINPKWPTRVKKFVAQCKAAGVSELSENGLTPEAYALEWEQLFFQKMNNSLSLNAAVTLVNPYTPEYSPKKERTLTDGLTGGFDFSYNWLFTYGNDMIATIDLGSIKTIHNVHMNFLQDAPHNIFNPAQIKIETSTDNSSYKFVKEQVIAVANKDYTVHINHFYFSLPTVNARYIRVSAKCLPALPSWRVADGKKPALCCDEIFVE